MSWLWLATTLSCILSTAQLSPAHVWWWWWWYAHQLSAQLSCIIHWTHVCAARCRTRETRETRAAMWGDTLPASNLYYLSTDGQKQMQINLSPAAMAWFVHRYCALPICSVNVNGWREDPCFSCGWVRAANDPSALTITEKVPSRGREVLMSS